ncbi:hypothetical protein ACIGCM_20275 [Pseudomonas sp. NPDC078700]|uniref:hypothetical protein n=1 Tax=Pseudomonas sp. NPDC078700 TaxID=3364424 RepID=UPI0037C5159E
MTPIFLPHTALDRIHELGPAAPFGKRLSHLQTLRDQAMERGAHVVLLIWPTFDWGMLAIDVPADVHINDARQLIPNVMANPELFEQMHRKAAAGKHLTWLKLEHPPAVVH